MTRRVPQSQSALPLDARQKFDATIAQLFNDHYDALCAYAEQILSAPMDAEDVVQTVFMALSERSLSCDDRLLDLPTASYLFGAVRNRAIDVIRHRTVETKIWRQWTGQQEPQTALPWHSQPATTPEEEAVANDLSQCVRAAVDSLPPRCRETFVLSRDHHLSYAEIAKIMGVTVATVELQMGRALKALQEVVRQARGEAV